MKTVLILQARMNSSRLPGKILMPLLGNIPLIGILLNRLKKAKKVDKIINYYVPLFNTANVNFEEPLEMKHLRTLRTDLLEYANLFTEFRKYYPE